MAAIRSNSHLLGNSAWNAGAFFVGVGLNLLILPFVLFRLGAAAFGVAGLVTTCIAPALGFSNALRCQRRGSWPSDCCLASAMTRVAFLQRRYCWRAQEVCRSRSCSHWPVQCSHIMSFICEANRQTILHLPLFLGRLDGYASVSLRCFLLFLLRVRLSRLLRFTREHRCFNPIDGGYTTLATSIHVSSMPGDGLCHRTLCLFCSFPLGNGRMGHGSHISSPTTLGSR